MVISASHNPYQDNGIKVFSRGEKFGETDERAVEAVIDDTRLEVDASAGPDSSVPI